MTITWLHLSDLHACNPRFGWDAERVTSTLVADLRRMAELGLRPDLVFFSGDAAFGEVGTDKDSTIAGQLEHFAQFLDAVRRAFKPRIPLTNVFLVPGNHDVNRSWVTTEQIEWLRPESHSSMGQIQAMIHQGGLQWRRYMERLGDYRAFLEKHGFNHLLGDPGRLIYSAVRKVGGLHVGIAGFNTAWSCCRDAERGRLWMAGKWQQGMLRRELAGADFSIALMHHPPDWLAEHENPDFGRGLDQDFRFLLHGHEHRAWVLSTAEGYSVIAAAACYERSDSEHNGYNLVRLDPETKRGEVWLRRFDVDGGGWIPRIVANKTDERGVWPLRLDWLAPRRVASRAAKKRTTTVQSEEPPAVQAEAEPVSAFDRYLQRLRAAHCNLPLAGFETKVRMPIAIHDVYIPLSARVMHSVMERDQHRFGTLRELGDMDLEEHRDLLFDESLSLARRHGLRGAVVLGDPGSGKTTLLKHFVLAATDPLIGPQALGLPDDTVPVLIELRRLKDAAKGLKAAIQAAVEKADIALEGEAASHFAGQLVGRDRLLILLDGLDEVADEEQRIAVARWLEEAVLQLPESTFVITSRYAGYKGEARLDGRFLELHVRDVEEEAARRFIAAWYLAVESQAVLGRDLEVAARLAEEAARDLADKIFDPEDARIKSLRQLARNPLMLQILCLVHRDRRQLPERRIELYRECVLVLLELWRRAKGMPVALDAQQALRLLQPLAYRLHLAERREADIDELLPHLETPLRELRRDLADGEKLLAAIRDQSGVLVSLGQKAYGFLHLSFQEYLTALYIQDRFVSEPAVLRQLAEKFGDPWWREVILLSLGLNNPSLFEPLFDVLLELGVLPHDVPLADDCLRDALATSPRPFLRALAGGLESAEERYHALRLLRALPGWQTVGVEGKSGRDLVEELIRDEDRQVQSMAVELLGGERRVPAVVVPGIRERLHEKDGSQLVHVPGGVFTLGTDEDLEGYIKDEYRDWPKPEHRARLSPFWIGKYPVTNAQYERFLAANPGQEKPEYWDDKSYNEPEQPVVGVSWLEAMAYCRWAGLELPTEAQWEAAARGTDARPYPWGDSEPSPELANFGGNERRPTPVGTYPKGAGPYGTLDQAGNVWEWCRDVFEEKAYRNRDSVLDPWIRGVDDRDERALRVVRGGSWGVPSGALRAAFRDRVLARLRIRYLGFRVVLCSVPEHGS